MNRTISTVIGLAFSLIFLAVILMSVSKTLNNADNDVRIMGLKASRLGSLASFSWQTSVATDGLVVCRVGIEDFSDLDYNFKRTHKVSLALSGPAMCRVQSCDITGTCASNDSVVI